MNAESNLNGSLDIGGLVTRLGTVSSFEELEELAQKAVELGHSGLIDNVYATANELALKEEHVPESVLSNFRIAFVRGDSEKMSEIMSDNGLGLNLPPERVLYPALVNAVVPRVKGTISHRGVTIDDPSTSVGTLYQRLYGTDYSDSEFNLREVYEILGVEIDANDPPVMVPYPRLVERERTAAHYIIIKRKLESISTGSTAVTTA